MEWWSDGEEVQNHFFASLQNSSTPFRNGDHDVTAASRPVKAFVPVRIRLVTPFRWAEDDRLSSTIRRAYRPWRKPWRSGFDSRHGVPPFDHATCPSDSAWNGNKTASAICAQSLRGFADSPVVQPRRTPGVSPGDVGSSGFEPRPSRRLAGFPSRLLSVVFFGMGRCASVIELVAQLRQSIS